MHGTAAVLATCHDAQEPDRVLLHWSHHGTFVLVSVLGATEVNQRLAVALADRLLLVPPSG